MARLPREDLPRHADAPAFAGPSALCSSPSVANSVTDGIRVEVESFYIPEQSDPADDRYVFAYRIRISNESDDVVQLVRRHWVITDGDGSTREVDGEGVVGEQPVLDCGETHEYMSGAVLRGPVGKMTGSYEMHRADGSMFDAAIPAFELNMPRTLH
ncbi:MAG: ApaG protein [Hyphomicrobiaceae bacterium]|jgi:ApaG protein